MTERLNQPSDYHAEWDVPSLGEEPIKALGKAVNALREWWRDHSTSLDNSQPIYLLQGTSGFGKTHLLGRLSAEHDKQIQVVFVAAPPDPSRPVDHIHHRLVEALFDDGGTQHSLIRRLLAQLLLGSFLAFFDQLPSPSQARLQAIRQTMALDCIGFLELTASVNSLAPYHHLADSLQASYPNLPARVVRALVLGLSPAAHEARCWLRGEAEQLTDSRQTELRLGPQSPTVVDVLQVLAAFLKRLSTPLVLCLDQLDEVIGKNAGYTDLAGQLMTWLQSIPNLLIVLGCMTDDWKSADGPANLEAFKRRVKSLILPSLTDQQAQELVSKRMKSWEGFDPASPDGFPFDQASVATFVKRKPTPPYFLIRRCREAFTDWLANGKKGVISISEAGPSLQPKELFLRDWNTRLEATRQKLKSPSDYADAELWGGVKESLEIARQMRHVRPGVEFEKYTEQAIKPKPTNPNYSAQVDLLAGDSRVSVVIAVNKKDAGTAFANWLPALEAVIPDDGGAVVVWPKAKLAVGPNAASFKTYKKHVDDKRILPFALDENTETFAHLECLRLLAADAPQKLVLLGGKPATLDECRRLIVETKVLENLKLFDFLFAGWPALKETGATPPSSPPPRTEPEPIRDLPSTPDTMAKPDPLPFTVAPTPDEEKPTPDWANQMLDRVTALLRRRGQPVKSLGVEAGPTFVRLRVEPIGDTDFGKVKRQADNLKVQLTLQTRPIISAQAGHISIDLQRPDRQVVHLTAILDTRPAGLTERPAFPIGLDVTGRAHWLDLSEPATCHLLVAGTTGSGKSQLLKALIAGLAHHLSPDLVQFVLIDPKRVTFSLSGDSPYMLRPVAFDASEAMPILEECGEEMERRYHTLVVHGKEHVGELLGSTAVPRWIVVFDEFADLMADRGSKKELERHLTRLGAKARAAGIHLILGTQRPEASVVTPLLRSNLPGRISLQVPTERDSKIILDEPDAAYLLDKGDLLWRDRGGLTRLQSPFVSREDLERFLRVH